MTKDREEPVKLSRDSAGRGFIGAFTDMEPAAALSSAAKLIDSFHVPIITFDSRGRVTSFNAGAKDLYGCSAGELPRESGFAPYAGDDEEATMAVVVDVIAGRRPGTKVLHHRRSDGAAIDVILSGMRIADSNGDAMGAIFTVHEFTPSTVVKRRLSEAETELRTTERAWTTLSHSAAVIVSAQDAPTLLDQICRLAVDVGGYPLAMVGLVDHDEEKSIRIVASAGQGAEQFAALRPSYREDPAHEGPATRALRERRPIAINRIRANNVAPRVHEVYARLGLKSSIGLPLLDRTGAPLGVLAVYAAETDQFDGAEVRLLSELAASVGYAVSNLRTQAERDEAHHSLRLANDQLQRILGETVTALGRVIEARDPYMQGHQERVAVLCRQIAQEMALSPHRIEGLATAALMHDVGKLAVPAEILNAQGRLGDLEMLLVRKHPAAGSDILSGIEFPWPVAQIVLQHHERWDGTGYPEGLSGNEIHLEAHIIAVADVVEAMTADRPHRPAMGFDEAIREVCEHREQYAPEVVDALLSLWKRQALSF